MQNTSKNVRMKPKLKLDFCFGAHTHISRLGIPDVHMAEYSSQAHFPLQLHHPMSDQAKQQAQDKRAHELQTQYNGYQETLTDLQTQLSTLTSQILEHTIVDKTLTEIPPQSRPTRKCFKMVGGVLTEKSVDDVILMLDEEKKELSKSKEQVEKELVAMKKEMEEWMTKHKVKIVRQ